jgi:hypothetical protein
MTKDGIGIGDMCLGEFEEYLREFDLRRAELNRVRGTVYTVASSGDEEITLFLIEYLEELALQLSIVISEDIFQIQRILQRQRVLRKSA